MSYDVNENGQPVIGGMTLDEIQQTVDARRKTKHKERARTEGQPGSAARQTTQYLSFGRTRLRRMIHAQEHAAGLMLKPYSEAILAKRLASPAFKTSEQMAAEKAQAPVTIKTNFKKRRKGGRR